MGRGNQLDVGEAEKVRELGRMVEIGRGKQLQGVDVFYDDAMLRRFLRARNYDVSRAFAMLEKYFKWREQVRIADVTVSDFQPELEKLVFFFTGKDEAGRLLLWVVPRKMDPKHRNADQFVKMFLYTMTAIEREQGEVEEVCAVIDLEGFHTGKNLDMELLKVMVDIFQNYWPERLHRAVLTNAPKLLDVVWKVVKRMLDSRTSKKVLFLNGPELLKEFPSRLVPASSGGTLSKEEAIYWFRRLYGEEAKFNEAALDLEMFAEIPSSM